jgi:hypothetical protein
MRSLRRRPIPRTPRTSGRCEPTPPAAPPDSCKTGSGPGIKSDVAESLPEAPLLITACSDSLGCHGKVPDTLRKTRAKLLFRYSFC